MTRQQSPTPHEIIDFWFPDGSEPSLAQHGDLWAWRMRGGAHAAVIAKYSQLAEQAAQGELDDWVATARGRLALIIVLDQFSRSVWAGTPRAYAQDPKALALCLEGLENGHYDALENVWQKTQFKLPLEHCECPEHLANLDRAVLLADKLREEAPEHLEPFYESCAQLPRLHRTVIARFGRHSHRNEILARQSTPVELDYIATGKFPHQSDISKAKKE